jgi:hypothetical protein
MTADSKTSPAGTSFAVICWFYLKATVSLLMPLVSCMNMSVDESLLTGESLAVGKTVGRASAAQYWQAGGEQTLPFVFSDHSRYKATAQARDGDRQPHSDRENRTVLWPAYNRSQPACRPRWTKSSK